ncbi:diguanylate cyclase (GGDEF) domain protein [compost metagenome]
MDPKQNSAMELLAELISDANTLLLSPREVTTRLNSLASKLFAGRLLVQVEQHGQTYCWGAFDEPMPRQVLRKGPLSSEVRFEVVGDRYPETDQEQQFLASFTALAKALWGSDIRPMGGTAWKQESVQAKLTPSVERLRCSSTGNSAVALLFADLDRFKNLNDQAGHERGDDAIRLVNRELHELCLRHGGLTFHPSGDEFYLVLPDNGLLPMMEALFELRKRVNTHQFKDANDQDHTVDLTLGLKFLDGTINAESLKAGFVDAEEATKLVLHETADLSSSYQSTAQDKNVKEKRRGRLSVFGTNNTASTSIDPDEFAKVAALMVRRNALTRAAVFRDPRLGMMQSAARNFEGDAMTYLGEHLRGTQDWLDIEVSSSCTLESILHETAPRAIPCIALAMAVAAGILQNRRRIHPDVVLDLRVQYSHDGKEASVVEGGHRVWGNAPTDPRNTSEVEIESPDAKRRASALIGVQVGFQESLNLPGGNQLPNELFSQVVVVDDRPNSGGGLPDFWQAALAQICKAASTESSLVHVFAWGRMSTKSETVRRLRGELEWSEDEIAYLADVSSKTIRELRPQLTDNTRTMCDTKSVVLALYEISPVAASDQDQSAPSRLFEADSLKREMLKLQSLQSTDGLRCKSAAQAYPIIIDTLRKAQTRISSDDAHQSLRELVAFKLALETPSQFPVPAYLRNQDSDMQRYADTVLLCADGPLRKGLESEGQLNAFKKELLACYTPGEAARSTRRACLVVPHIPTEDGNPSPQGLVTVWASPRLNDMSQRIVDWVFVWRTVEAFIGLPYSLYGSIQLAQTLLLQVNKDLSDSASTPLRLGELTYIALSLHMRSDGVHRRIAKRIVDESSE